MVKSVKSTQKETVVADLKVATEVTAPPTNVEPTKEEVGDDAVDSHYTGGVEEKSLGNTTVNGAKKNVSDLVIYGNGDMFQLLCKASSVKQGWMKSTKAMQVHGGCLVQVTTQQKNPDGSYAVAEALQFVPGVKIALVNGDKTKGRFLTRG